MTKGFKCDDCKDFLAFSEPTAEIQFSGDGLVIPMTSTSHLCEECAKKLYEKLKGGL